MLKSIRWNLLIVGAGLLVLVWMVIAFLRAIGMQNTEASWLLIGTAVGGYIGYSMAVVTGLTGAPPSMTEETVIEILKLQRKEEKADSA